MTPTWFNSATRVNALEASAASWIGTPFSPNGRAKGKGGGVSCQMLAAALMMESGFLESFSVPVGKMNWARRNSESVIEPFLDAHPRFRRLELGAPLFPGDVLGFKIGKCIHHMGTMLRNEHFIHVFETISVIKVPIADPTYRDRLAAIWRPKL